MSVSGTSQAPVAIAAGTGFKAMFEARLTSIGTTIVQLSPIEDDTDQCLLSSVEVMSGIDMGNNQFLLYNVPGTFTAAEEELQMHTLAPFVRLSVGYTTRPNVGGVCNVKAQLLQPLEVPPVAPIDLSKAVEVQLPAVPVFMGKIQTLGSWDVDDGAVVEVPATFNFTFTCLPGACAIQLAGVASHSDGNDWGDYGRFWYWGPGVAADNGMSISDDTVGQAYEVVTEPEHEVDTWVKNRYCYLGQYVDGGSTDTWELPRAETCADIWVYEPNDPKVRLPELCDYYNDPPVQIQFDLGREVVYLRALTGPLAGSTFGLSQLEWGELCQGRLPIGPVDNPIPDETMDRIQHLIDYVIAENPIGPIENPIGPIENPLDGVDPWEHVPEIECEKVPPNCDP